MARELETSELRAELLGTRAAVLDARVAIYSVNFGEASRHLEGARGLLGRVDQRLKGLGLDDEVRQVQTARASIDDAQRMAGKLDQNIAGVDLPLNKRVEIGLTYIYGIGRPKANFILEKADVRPDTR